MRSVSSIDPLGIFDCWKMNARVKRRKTKQTRIVSVYSRTTPRGGAGSGAVARSSLQPVLAPTSAPVRKLEIDGFERVDGSVDDAGSSDLGLFDHVERDERPKQLAPTGPPQYHGAAAESPGPVERPQKRELREGPGLTRQDDVSRRPL